MSEPTCPCLLDGKWGSPATERFENFYNPSTGEAIGQVPMCRFTIAPGLTRWGVRGASGARCQRFICVVVGPTGAPPRKPTAFSALHLPTALPASLD